MTNYRMSSKVTALRNGRFAVFVTATALGANAAEPLTERRECASATQAEICRQDLSRHLTDCVAGLGGRIVSVEIA